MKQFEVGKKYRYADGRKTYAGAELTKDYFECHSVDEDGYCWSRDTLFMGGAAGYTECCMGSSILLDMGTVIEVEV